MKKFAILKFWLVSCIAFVSYPISAAEELGEFCWQNTENSCLLKLQVTQHGNYLSFNGRQLCSGNFAYIDQANSHVSGSGFIKDGAVKIGLQFISYHPTDESQHSFTTFRGDLNLTDLLLSGNLAGSIGVDSKPNYTHVEC